MMNAVNAFPLMSIPFFILAGELMLKAGMMDRIIDLANAVVGRVRGGLAHVTMLAGLGLSTVSGAAVADASALGSTLIPSLRKVYGVGFSSAVVAAAANLGPIIPPSGAMIVYAFMAGPTVSVGGMFMAGVIPGLILVAAMMAACSIIAVRRKYPLTGDSFSIVRIFHELKRSIIIFLMPVVVIGGIVGGAFTATEGSAIAVVYALGVGFFVTRKLRLKDLPEAMVRTAITSAVVGAMIAFASVVTYMLTLDLLPQKLTELIRSMTSSPIVFMLIVAVGALRRRHVPRVERRLHHARPAAASDRAEVRHRSAAVRVPVRVQPGDRHADAAGRRGAVRPVRHHRAQARRADAGTSCRSSRSCTGCSSRACSSRRSC